MNIKIKEGKAPEFQPVVGDLLYSNSRPNTYFLVIDVKPEHLYSGTTYAGSYNCVEFNLKNKTVKHTLIETNSEISNTWFKTEQELTISNY